MRLDSGRRRDRARARPRRRRGERATAPASLLARRWRARVRRTAIGRADTRCRQAISRETSEAMGSTPAAPAACWAGAGARSPRAVHASGRRAPPRQCVVGTWGGDYARLLRENIDDAAAASRRASRSCRRSATRRRASRKLVAQKTAAARRARHRLRRRAATATRGREGPAREPRRDQGAEPEKRAAVMHSGMPTASCRTSTACRGSPTTRTRSSTRRSSFGDLLEAEMEGQGRRAATHRASGS